MKGVAHGRIDRIFHRCTMKRNKNAEQGNESLQDTASAERPPTKYVDGEKKDSQEYPGHKENGDHVQQRRLGKI